MWQMTGVRQAHQGAARQAGAQSLGTLNGKNGILLSPCLLYTSDAADE